MRVPTDTIAAPMFPARLRWVNVASLRMDKQRGRPVLLEFFDFCRPASLRTLPYLKAWNERYAEAGLRVISVHAPGFPPGRDEEVVTAAVQRLGIEHPVLLDTDFTLWNIYENEGWPARYLFNQDLRLFEVHFGEGGYRETEAAIQELLGVEGDPVPYQHPEDDPEARIVVPTTDRPARGRGLTRRARCGRSSRARAASSSTATSARSAIRGRICSWNTATTSTGCSTCRWATA